MGLKEDLDVYIYPVYKSRTLKGSTKRYIPDSFAIESASGELRPRTLEDPYFVHILTGFKSILDVVCITNGCNPNNREAVMANALSYQAMTHYCSHAAYAIRRELIESGYLDRLKKIYPPEQVDEEVERRIPTILPDADAELLPRLEDEVVTALFRLVGGRQKQETPFTMSDLAPE